MANNVPREIGNLIKDRVTKRADAFGYAGRTRVENGAFMDDLIRDSEIGGVLSEYMPKGNIRTYIKDGILNRYTKILNKEIQEKYTAEDIVKAIYNQECPTIDSKGKVCLCCHDGKDLYVISSGTVLKWETALRKGLEYISMLPESTKNKKPKLCLKLTVINNLLSASGKLELKEQLNLISVDVFFCE